MLRLFGARFEPTFSSTISKVLQLQAAHLAMLKFFLARRRRRFSSEETRRPTSFVLIIASASATRDGRRSCVLTTAVV